MWDRELQQVQDHPGTDNESNGGTCESPSGDSSSESSSESVFFIGTRQSASMTQALPTFSNSSSDITSSVGKYVISNLCPLKHWSKTCILTII